MEIEAHSKLGSGAYGPVYRGRLVKTNTQLAEMMKDPNERPTAPELKGKLEETIVKVEKSTGTGLGKSKSQTSNK